MRVFNTQQELDLANEKWIIARASVGITDTRNGEPITPQITQKWSEGRQTTDGRIACETPTQWADEFGGVETEITESDFPPYNTI